MTKFNVTQVHGSSGGTEDKTIWYGRIETKGLRLEEVTNRIDALPYLLENHVYIDTEIEKHMGEIEGQEWTFEDVVLFLCELQNKSREAIAKAEVSQ